MKRNIINTLLVGIILLFIVSGCERDRNHPGHTYFNDMTPSTPYNYYSPNPNFEDGATARQPVEGTIPRDNIPYQYPKTADGQILAGKGLINNIPKTKENLEIGKVEYTRCCAMCHGDQGKGDGKLVTRGKFTMKVTSLVDDFVQNKPDGEIYHVITLGSVSGFMGSQSAQIKPDDRWKVVNYIKNKLSTN